MGRALGILAVALCALSAPDVARADAAADAEALVRAVYYDDFPHQRARDLPDAGIARLGGMLADPTEAPHHGNVVLALGLSGHSDAFALLADYAASAPEGETDRSAFRARTRVPIAMGHLARHDRRALGWLMRAARREREPDWHFRHHRGARLGVLLEETALTGLALSGAPEADALLDAEARRPGSDVAAERRRRHAEGALALHEEIGRRGPDAVLRGGSSR